MCWLAALAAGSAGCSSDETSAALGATETVDASVPPPTAADEAAGQGAGEKAPLGAGMPVVTIWRRPKPVDAGAVSEPATDAGNQVPEADARVAELPPMQAPVAPALPKPVHRYDFTGDDARVVDVVGGANGTARNGARLEQGAVRLDGADDFVELPPGLLSGLSDVTILVWLSWEGGECWQRVLDFGQAFRRDDGAVNVVSSLFLTPRSCPSNFPEIGYVSSAGSEHIVSDAQLVSTAKLQLGLTFDSAAQVLRLIVDGQTISEQRSALRLETLRAADSWIGRSHFVNDPGLRGRIDELRIYASALDQETLSTLYERGPDAP